MNKSCESYCIGGTSCDGCPNQYLDIDGDFDVEVINSSSSNRRLVTVTLGNTLQKEREIKINKILE